MTTPSIDLRVLECVRLSHRPLTLRNLCVKLKRSADWVYPAARRLELSGLLRSATPPRARKHYQA